LSDPQSHWKTDLLKQRPEVMRVLSQVSFGTPLGYDLPLR
jgi:hypothetical protein